MQLLGRHRESDSTKTTPVTSYTYRVVQQRIQLVMPCSSFSTMYCVMKPPPSFSGGFHVNINESW